VLVGPVFYFGEDDEQPMDKSRARIQQFNPTNPKSTIIVEIYTSTSCVFDSVIALSCDRNGVLPGSCVRDTHRDTVQDLPLGVL
jgi:hypothetical protein